MAQAYMRGMPVEQDANVAAPLITLFERDDSIAVPLLSQLRMAGYDVRSARTPVELFDILGKHLVMLVLVDLGAATAGRREFWVALDAHRRGRSAMQVLTFRFIAPANDLALDFEPSARAIADVEMHGAHEFQLVIDAVRQRAPLHGLAPAANVSYTPDGAIQPLGVALGLPPAAAYGAQGYGQGYGQPFGQGYGGAAFGMTPLPQGAAFRSTPSGAGGFNSMPSGPFAPPSFPPGAPMPAMSPMQGYGQGYGAQVETTPFPEGMYGAAGFPQVMLPGAGHTPQSQSYGQPGGYGASPFAYPTAANPFPTEVETSPFANPYGSNPFSQDSGAPSGPSSPLSPFAFGAGQSANPFATSFNAPSGMSGVSGASGPSVPGFSQPFAGGPSSWGASGGYVTDARHFAEWRTPDAGPVSFGSDPGSHSMFGAQQAPVSGYGLPPEPSAPVFQDAWTPPDDAAEMETGALTEDAFQPHAAAAAPDDAWSMAISEPRHPTAEPHYESAQERPWDAPRVSGDLPRHDVGTHFTAAPYDSPDVSADVFDRSTAAVETPISSAPTHALPPTPANTPTDAALSSVLVEGALLTPGKLETLRGIQTMLTATGQPRKLGELAVMFKFLSADQLLAALLVSRGLVSPQQIASLGRVKQERAAAGQANDLETLLVQFNMVPAEQLRTLRQELAS
ncbi:MAG TPA: hypothetical protein VHI51_00245 [Ktedonobacterales bacterium]|nr:hypothetical protein [Ktedonobacterales bacterium]